MQAEFFLRTNPSLGTASEVNTNLLGEIAVQERMGALIRHHHLSLSALARQRNSLPSTIQHRVGGVRFWADIRMPNQDIRTAERRGRPFVVSFDNLYMTASARLQQLRARFAEEHARADP